MASPVLLGHRGWSARYPENTGLAFRHALTRGADGFEFDVQCTADGVVVVLHDQTVDRTTDGHGNVATYRYNDLRKLNAAARWPRETPQQIPTLKEVLDIGLAQKCRGMYNIEIKTYTDDWPEVVERTIRIVNAHPLRSQILYSSFNHPAMAYLHRLDTCARTGLLFETPEPLGWRLAKQVGAATVNMDHHFMDVDFVRDCHQHGVQCVAWTVDDVNDFAAMRSYGVDIIISNCVGKMVKLRHRSPARHTKNVRKDGGRA